MSPSDDDFQLMQSAAALDDLAVRDSRARAIRRKRNVFRSHPTPTEPMSRVRANWFSRAMVGGEAPTDLAPFADWFAGQEDARERFRWALRDSLDELLDGQRTGRWCYQHLSKTEKTYLGTAVEVNLTKEFEIPNGDDLDWRVADADLDCKFSRDLGGWEIPMEMYRCADHGEREGKTDQVALLTWMNDDLGQWAAGLLRMTDQRLRWRPAKDSAGTVRAYNRDNKRRISDAAVPDIFWLWDGLQDDLPNNLLLHLTPDVRGRILTGSSGQGRVDRLFQEVQERIIGRHTVLTVAQQADAPKRARDARLRLRHRGIVVLGHQESHPVIASALGLPVPTKGEWISTRLVEVSGSDNRPSIALDGKHWTRARPGDPVVAAPMIPKRYP